MPSSGYREDVLWYLCQVAIARQADSGVSLPARSADALPARNSIWAFNLAPAFPRGALTLLPQLCLGISSRR